MSALTPENTVSAEHVRHKLLLGIAWTDAVADQAVGLGWTSELRALGTRPIEQRFEVHARGRHALRQAGRLASLLVRAAQDKVATPPPTPDVDPTNLVLQAYGQADANAPAYSTGNDPRRYVPRRLSLTPVQSGGIPAATIANIREAWLWPGATYPLPAHASVVIGCVRRGASLATAQPVAWARVVFTRPTAGPADFNAEDKLGYAHGDDRGEFRAVFGPGAVPGGAALPDTIALNAWVFLPPAAPAFDAADPLASLPQEFAGTDAVNDLLRGIAIPTGYVQQSPLSVDLPLGAVFAIADAQLLFP